MLESYFKHESDRKKQGIPPLPLNAGETEEVTRLLESPPSGKEELLLGLIRDRVAPGVNPSAKVKASWLTKVARGEVSSPVIARKDAVFLLGTMLGGYNVDPLVSFLEDDEIASEAAKALGQIILVYKAFDRVVELSKGNSRAKEILSSWARGEWFVSRPEFPEKMTLKVFKVEGEIKRELEREISSFLWGIEAGRKVYLKSDPVVMKAFEVLPRARKLIEQS